MDITVLETYLNEVKGGLGKSWLIEADSINVGPVQSVGAIAKSYAINCFMMGTSVAECIKHIKSAFPEAKDG